MFTGSADSHHPTEESTAGVAIRRPRPSARTSSTVEIDHGLDLARGSGFDPDEIDLTGLTAGDDAWMDLAACKGRTSLFFGRAGERPERRIRRERSAREMCATCAVLQRCRDRARAGRENGFWGGESEEERAAAGFPPRSISRRSVQRASSVGVATG